jgi:transforming growth factor-beta-induced protein
MSSRPILSFVTVVACAAAVSACSDSNDPAPVAPDTGTIADTGAVVDTAGGDTIAKKDLVDTAIGAGTFKTLVAAVQAAGLESTLRGTGPFTVFAPNDDAFKKSVPDFLLASLTSAPYKTELGLILKYHVLSGSVPASAVLGKKQTVDTVSGAKLSVDGSMGKVVINGGPTVSTADVGASNGVIHVIDGVLLPTIVDTAVGYDDGTTKFATLVTAVKAADLVATLSGPGTFTVFAPTDKAFDDLKKALGDAAFAAILADKAKLTKILTYHVLPAIAYAKDVKTGDATTVEGSKLKLTASGGKVTVGDSTTTAANVALADLPNSNGVIHVIDKVLIPAGL